MQELIEKVKPVFGDRLKRVVLYGSYARGDYDEGSDVDVMLLIEKEEEALREDIDQVISLETEIGLQHDVFISPFLQSYAKYIKYLPDIPFYQNIEREGIVIYE